MDFDKKKEYRDLIDEVFQIMDELESRESVTCKFIATGNDSRFKAAIKIQHNYLIKKQNDLMDIQEFMDYDSLVVKPEHKGQVFTLKPKSDA